MFNNLRLSTKIGLGFGLVLTLLLVLAFAAYWGVRRDLAGLESYRGLARDNVKVAALRAGFLEVRVDAKEALVSKTKEAIETCAKSQANVRGLLAEARKQVTAPERARTLALFEERFLQYEKGVNETIAIASQADAAARVAQLRADNVRLGSEIQVCIQDLTESITADQVKLGSAFQTRVERLVKLILALSCVSLAVGILAAFFLTRSITRALHTVINDLTNGANQTASASAQVAAASQTLAEGASEQAASLEETGSSLEEISSMIRRNADNAQQANVLARSTRTAADRGATDMQQMSAAMEVIQTSSSDIGKIIKTIDEIAFQTNILALNAAVEAARAGEAGMGFAVVADEVRNLAQRSAQAAKETAAKIEGAIGNTQQGVAICATVAKGLQEIVASVRKVDELVDQVAAASKEQSQGITQVNAAVGQMDKVIQANAASAEESASASEELSAQAECLADTVRRLVAIVEGAAASSSVSTHATRLSTRRQSEKPSARAAEPAPASPAPSNGNHHFAPPAPRQSSPQGQWV